MKRMLPLLLILVFTAGSKEVNPAAAAPARGTASAISVTIVGPTRLYPRTGCDWTAYVGGGTAPYAYSWTASTQARGSGIDEFWTGYFVGTGTLTVTVTDALGATATDTHTVTATNNPWDMCP